MYAGIFLTIGAISLIFAGYFSFNTVRIANRNVLNRRVEVLARLRRRPSQWERSLETLINQVYVIDARLVRMKVVVTIALLAAGGFLLVVGYRLIR